MSKSTGSVKNNDNDTEAELEDVLEEVLEEDDVDKKKKPKSKNKKNGTNSSLLTAGALKLHDTKNDQKANPHEYNNNDVDHDDENEQVADAYSNVGVNDLDNHTNHTDYLRSPSDPKKKRRGLRDNNINNQSNIGNGSGENKDHNKQDLDPDPDSNPDDVIKKDDLMLKTPQQTRSAPVINSSQNKQGSTKNNKPSSTPITLQDYYNNELKEVYVEPKDKVIVTPVKNSTGGFDYHLTINYETTDKKGQKKWSPFELAITEKQIEERGGIDGIIRSIEFSDKINQELKGKYGAKKYEAKNSLIAPVHPGNNNLFAAYDKNTNTVTGYCDIDENGKIIVKGEGYVTRFIPIPDTKFFAEFHCVTKEDGELINGKLVPQGVWTMRICIPYLDKDGAIQTQEDRETGRKYSAIYLDAKEFTRAEQSEYKKALKDHPESFKIPNVTIWGVGSESCRALVSVVEVNLAKGSWSYQNRPSANKTIKEAKFSDICKSKLTVESNYSWKDNFKTVYKVKDSSQFSPKGSPKEILAELTQYLDSDQNNKIIDFGALLNGFVGTREQGFNHAGDELIDGLRHILSNYEKCKVSEIIFDAWLFIGGASDTQQETIAKLVNELAEKGVRINMNPRGSKVRKSDLAISQGKFINNLSVNMGRDFITVNKDGDMKFGRKNDISFRDINTNINHDLLYEAIISRQDHKVTKLLLGDIKFTKIDLNHRVRNGKTYLMLAASLGDVKLVELLLEKDENKSFVNAQDKEGQTALMHAINNHHLQDIKIKNLELLLGGGADVNLADHKDNTPLMIAAQKGDEKIVEKLLSIKNIDIDAKNKDGKTALMIAAESQNLDLLKILLDENADLKNLNIADLKESLEKLRTADDLEKNKKIDDIIGKLDVKENYAPLIVECNNELDAKTKIDALENVRDLTIKGENGAILSISNIDNLTPLISKIEKKFTIEVALSKNGLLAEIANKLTASAKLPKEIDITLSKGADGKADNKLDESSIENFKKLIESGKIKKLSLKNVGVGGSDAEKEIREKLIEIAAKNNVNIDITTDDNRGFGYDADKKKLFCENGRFLRLFDGKINVDDKDNPKKPPRIDYYEEVELKNITSDSQNQSGMKYFLESLMLVRKFKPLKKLTINFDDQYKLGNDQIDHLIKAIKAGKISDELIIENVELDLGNKKFRELLHIISISGIKNFKISDLDRREIKIDMIKVGKENDQNDQKDVKRLAFAGTDGEGFPIDKNAAQIIDRFYVSRHKDKTRLPRIVELSKIEVRNNVEDKKAYEQILGSQKRNIASELGVKINPGVAPALLLNPITVIPAVIGGGLYMTCKGLGDIFRQIIPGVANHGEVSVNSSHSEPYSLSGTKDSPVPFSKVTDLIKNNDNLTLGFCDFGGDEKFGEIIASRLDKGQTSLITDQNGKSFRNDPKNGVLKFSGIEGNLLKIGDQVASSLKGKEYKDVTIANVQIKKDDYKKVMDNLAPASKLRLGHVNVIPSNSTLIEAIKQGKVGELILDKDHVITRDSLQKILEASQAAGSDLKKLKLQDLLINKEAIIYLANFRNDNKLEIEINGCNISDVDLKLDGTPKQEALDINLVSAIANIKADPNKNITINDDNKFSDLSSSLSYRPISQYKDQIKGIVVAPPINPNPRLADSIAEDSKTIKNIHNVIINDGDINDVTFPLKINITDHENWKDVNDIIRNFLGARKYSKLPGCLTIEDRDGNKLKIDHDKNGRISLSIDNDSTRLDKYFVLKPQIIKSISEICEEFDVSGLYLNNVGVNKNEDINPLLEILASEKSRVREVEIAAKDGQEIAFDEKGEKALKKMMEKKSRTRTRLVNSGALFKEITQSLPIIAALSLDGVVIGDATKNALIKSAQDTAKNNNVLLRINKDVEIIRSDHPTPAQSIKSATIKGGQTDTQNQIRGALEAGIKDIHITNASHLSTIAQLLEREVNNSGKKIESLKLSGTEANPPAIAAKPLVIDNQGIDNNALFFHENGVGSLKTLQLENVEIQNNGVGNNFAAIISQARNNEVENFSIFAASGHNIVIADEKDSKAAFKNKAREFKEFGIGGIDMGGGNTALARMTQEVYNSQSKIEHFTLGALRSENGVVDFCDVIANQNVIGRNIASLINESNNDGVPPLPHHPNLKKITLRHDLALKNGDMTLILAAFNLRNTTNNKPFTLDLAGCTMSLDNIVQLTGTLAAIKSKPDSKLNISEIKLPPVDINNLVEMRQMGAFVKELLQANNNVVTGDMRELLGQITGENLVKILKDNTDITHLCGINPSTIPNISIDQALEIKKILDGREIVAGENMLKNLNKELSWRGGVKLRIGDKNSPENVVIGAYETRYLVGAIKSGKIQSLAFENVGISKKDFLRISDALSEQKDTANKTVEFDNINIIHTSSEVNAAFGEICSKYNVRFGKNFIKNFIKIVKNIKNKGGEITLVSDEIIKPDNIPENIDKVELKDVTIDLTIRLYKNIRGIIEDLFIGKPLKLTNLMVNFNGDLRDQVSEDDIATILDEAKQSKLWGKLDMDIHSFANLNKIISKEGMNVIAGELPQLMGKKKYDQFVVNLDQYQKDNLMGGLKDEDENEKKGMDIKNDIGGVEEEQVFKGDNNLTEEEKTIKHLIQIIKPNTAKLQAQPIADKVINNNGTKLQGNESNMSAFV